MDDVGVLDDGELWRRAGSGDAEAFTALFDRHAGAVRAYCARRTGSLDASEDLVSIVFLEAWRRRGQVELVHDSALPWLYGVASHTIAHRTRTTLRHRRAISRLPPVMLAPDHAEDVAARIDDQRRLEAVRRAMGGLSRADQDVLVLCAWQQLDYAAAAVALGVPVGTVRSRLSRARARLARAVQERPPEPAGPVHGEARARADPARSPITAPRACMTAVPDAPGQQR